MKNIELFLISIIPTFVLLLLLLLLPKNQKPINQKSPKPIVQFIRQPQRTRQPEFRQPPYRNYKPNTFQQVGLLSSTNETLPLYGKASEIYNNRWNYYTSTPGQQIYSLPVSVNNRDCTEDIGCDELYDNQSVSVYSKDGINYDTKIYKIDQHPYSLEF